MHLNQKDDLNLKNDDLATIFFFFVEARRVAKNGKKRYVIIINLIVFAFIEFASR